MLRQASSEASNSGAAMDRAASKRSDNAATQAEIASSRGIAREGRFAGNLKRADLPCNVLENAKGVLLDTFGIGFSDGGFRAW